MSVQAATLAPVLPGFAPVRWRMSQLVIDLGGDDFGNVRWWRGLATLLLLCGLTIHLGFTVPPLAEPVRPAQFERQRGELATLGTAPLAMGGAGAPPAPIAASVERLAEPPERPIVAAVAHLGQGGIAAALRTAGVGPEDSARVVELAEGQAGVLPQGTLFEMMLGRRETKAVPRPLESLIFRAAFDLKVKIARAADGGLALTRIPIAVDSTPLRLEARVGSSFYRAAHDAGAPAPIIGEFEKLLSYRLDFERDVRGRDRFDLLLEHKRAATGEEVTGGLIYAKLDRADAAPIEMLRWAHAGHTEFFLGDGSSAKKGLIGTPVNGARISSGFGFRFHPILGYSRMHQGTDFAAPTGSPILAAAAGRVEFVGWHGGHGNYVRIWHNPHLATAYGHMSRFGVRPGQAVAQGQVIGWVGSTGLSTGPHLHYETWLNGKAVDPRLAHLPTGTQLAGGELASFHAALAHARGEGRGAATEVADADPVVKHGKGRSARA